MSMFDPTHEQIVFQFATDRMWTDANDGSVEAPTGYFGAMSVTDTSQALELLHEWQFGLSIGLVLDVKPADLIGHWFVQGTEGGNHYVSRCDSSEHLDEVYLTYSNEYTEWLDSEEGEI